MGPVYEHSHAALRRAFVVFDSDGSGFIERGELEAMLTRLKLMPADAPREHLDRLLALADTDGDGRVSFDEFVSLFGEASAGPAA